MQYLLAHAEFRTSSPNLIRIGKKARPLHGWWFFSAKGLLFDFFERQTGKS